MSFIRVAAFSGALALAPPIVAPLLAAGVDPDGVCDPQEQVLNRCFVTAEGFVVEVVPGPSGEFPVIDGNGNSVFSYLITGPGAAGGSCQDVNDISHVDILLPICPDAPIVVVSSTPDGERLTNGQGDPSCNFGTGDLTHDVWKWDFPTSCDSAGVYSIVLQGVVPAMPNDFLVKTGSTCEVETILGPSCPPPPPPTTSFCDGDGSANGGADCPCLNNGDPGHGCDNGTGGALLTATGDPSVSNDTLSLTVTGILPSTPGMYFYGTTAAGGGDGVPFGNGLRCIEGALRVAKQTGGGSFPPPGSPPLSVLLGIDAGETTLFQYWYRNADGPCMGLGVNTTNGIQVTWSP